MDAEKISKINTLAKSLKDSHLVANMEDGVAKAKDILGYQDVIFENTAEKKDEPESLAGGLKTVNELFREEGKAGKLAEDSMDELEEIKNEFMEEESEDDEEDREIEEIEGEIEKEKEEVRELKEDAADEDQFLSPIMAKMGKKECPEEEDDGDEEFNQKACGEISSSGEDNPEREEE